MIKLVVFDLDGTIADTIPLCMAAFKKAADPYAYKELTENDIVQTFGLNEEGMLKQVIEGDNWEKALKDFYTYYESMHELYTETFEGIKEFIAELKSRSIHVAMVTGKGEHSCKITLKKLGMDKCFEKIETGSAIKNRKGESMKELLVHYNLTPEQMVYIGDAVSDITASREAGVRCLSAAWSVSPEIAQWLERENSGNVFYSIEEVRAVIIP